MKVLLRLLRICAGSEPCIGCLSNEEIDNIPEKED